MEAMRVSWTDGRLDDLKDEVVRQGARIDSLGARIDALSERVDSQSDWLSKRIDAQSERIDAQVERIDALNRTIIAVGGRIFGGCIAITVAIIGLIATQL